MHARMILAAILAMAGCTGAIGGSGPKPAGGGPSTPPSGSGSPGPGGPSVPGGSPGTSSPGASLPPIGADPLEPDRSNPACKDINPGPAPIRRLTRTEYDNTVRDLLGEDKGLAKTLPGRGAAAQLRQQRRAALGLRRAGRELRTRRQGDRQARGRQAGHASCPAIPAKDGESGLSGSVPGRLRQAGLAPAAGPASEKADLKKVFTAGRHDHLRRGHRRRGAGDAAVAAVHVPARAGRAGAGRRATSASATGTWPRGCRTCCGAPCPTPTLFAAAEAGKLGTRDEVAAQAKRMLDDPRATAMVTNFAGQWLHLRELADADKDTDDLPGLEGRATCALFRQETESFVEQRLEGRRQAGHPAVGALHRRQRPAGGLLRGQGRHRRRLPEGRRWTPTQRAGVLTHASILAAKSGPDQSSPILRGVFVREQMFCQPLPQPPRHGGRQPARAERDDDHQGTLRRPPQRSRPARAATSLIDPIGFGFEKYDATGAYRTMENGKTVDATGELVGTDVDGTFNGAIELAQEAGRRARTVEACMASHWFNFALGREPTRRRRLHDRDAEDRPSPAAAATCGSCCWPPVQTDAFFFKGGLR